MLFCRPLPVKLSSVKMQRKPVVPKSDSFTSMPTQERKASNSPKAKSSPCCGQSRIPVRPKSANHCCGATNQPERHPWSSSVYVDRKSSERHDTSPALNRKLGHIPAYIKKRRSVASLGKAVNQGKVEERLEDETPPPLVPSEISRTEKSLRREGTFDQTELEGRGGFVPIEVHKQLVDALKDLTEEKQMLEAQKQWFQDESASRLKMIETESQRNKQLASSLQQVTEELDRLRSEKTCSESFEDLRLNRDELKWQVEKLISENTSLRKDNEALREQQSGDDILCLERDIDPNQTTETIEHLERNLVKYRAARRKLKGIVEKLISENHRLRESIERHRNEGSFVDDDVVETELNRLNLDAEIGNRAEYFEERRKQKRSQQKCIDVRKYEL